MGKAGKRDGAKKKREFTPESGTVDTYGDQNITLESSDLHTMHKNVCIIILCNFAPPCSNGVFLG